MAIFGILEGISGKVFLSNVKLGAFMAKYDMELYFGQYLRHQKI